MFPEVREELGSSRIVRNLDFVAGRETGNKSTSSPPDSHQFSVEDSGLVEHCKSPNRETYPFALTAFPPIERAVPS